VCAHSGLFPKVQRKIISRPILTINKYDWCGKITLRTLRIDYCVVNNKTKKLTCTYICACVRARAYTCVHAHMCRYRYRCIYIYKPAPAHTFKIEWILSSICLGISAYISRLFVYFTHLYTHTHAVKKQINLLFNLFGHIRLLLVNGEFRLSQVCVCVQHRCQLLKMSFVLNLCCRGHLKYLHFFFNRSTCMTACASAISARAFTTSVICVLRISASLACICVHIKVCYKFYILMYVTCNISTFSPLDPSMFIKSLCLAGLYMCKYKCV